MCDKIQGEGSVLYVSGEESAEQIKIRADRLGIKKDNILFLSETDIECLNYAIDLCRDMTFSELTQFSHGLAWTKGCMRDNISFSDMLVEVHDEDGYIDYISAKRKLNEAVGS